MNNNNNNNINYDTMVIDDHNDHKNNQDFDDIDIIPQTFPPSDNLTTSTTTTTTSTTTINSIKIDPRLKRIERNIQTIDSEIIYFKSPTNESALFINKLAPQTTETDLREFFNEFGYINELRMNPLKNCAIVRYYRAIDRIEAEKYYLDHEIKFYGQPCEISKSTFRVFTKVLPLGQCVSLLQKYVGFDSISTEFISWVDDQKTFNEAEDNSGGQIFVRTIKARLLCRIEEQDLKFWAEGVGTYESYDVREALENSKKAAITNARKNLFSQLALLFLPTREKAILYLVNQSSIYVPEEPQTEEGIDLLTFFKTECTGEPIPEPKYQHQQQSQQQQQ